MPSYVALTLHSERPITSIVSAVFPQVGISGWSLHKLMQTLCHLWTPHSTSFCLAPRQKRPNVALCMSRVLVPKSSRRKCLLISHPKVQQSGRKYVVSHGTSALGQVLSRTFCYTRRYPPTVDCSSEMIEHLLTPLLNIMRLPSISDICKIFTCGHERTNFVEKPLRERSQTHGSVELIRAT